MQFDIRNETSQLFEKFEEVRKSVYEALTAINSNDVMLHKIKLSEVKAAMRNLNNLLEEVIRHSDQS